MNICALEPHVAEQFWPEIERFVAAAIEHDLTNSTSVAKVRQDVQQGTAKILLAVTDEGAVMSSTVIEIYRDAKDQRTLHVLATAGVDRDAWLGELIDELARIAELEECDGGVTMHGRPGWQRELAKYGWRTDAVAMRLQHGRISEIGREHPSESGKLQPELGLDDLGERVGVSAADVH